MAMMSAATFRMPGNATSRQTLFVLLNTGTAVTVSIRRLVAQVEATGVSLSLMPLIKVCRISSYTGGQALTKVNWSATTSSAQVQARGRNTIDGGSQTDIVATIGDTLWQQYTTRGASSVGQRVGDDQNIAPMAIESNPIVLRANQGILVYVEAMAGTSNPNSLHYFVQCAWDED